MAEQIKRSIVMTPEMVDTIKRMATKHRREFSAECNELWAMALADLNEPIVRSEPEVPNER